MNKRRYNLLVLTFAIIFCLPITLIAQERPFVSAGVLEGLKSTGALLSKRLDNADDLLYRMKVKRDAGQFFKHERKLLEQQRLGIEEHYEAFADQLDLVEKELIDNGKSALLSIHLNKTEELQHRIQQILESLDQKGMDSLMQKGIPFGKIRSMRDREQKRFHTKVKRGIGTGQPAGPAVAPLKKAPREVLTDGDKKQLFTPDDKFGLLQSDTGTFELVRIEKPDSLPTAAPDALLAGGAHVSDLDIRHSKLAPSASWDLELPQTARPVMMAGLAEVQSLLSLATLQALTPPTAADLQEDGLDIVFTDEIKEVAEYLDRDAIKIYEYVKNNILYQPYWGALKGAQQTLMSGSGNDMDQAGLMIALLRYSGFPARYGRALVTVDIERAKKWLGVTDDTCVDLMLATGEIPGVTALVDTDTGKIMAVRFEHVYVEVWLPYANYRGSAQDATHELWVPLAPAFKQHRVAEGSGLAADVPFDADTFVDYLDANMTKNPDGSLSGIDDAYIQLQMQDYEQQLHDQLADNMTVHEVAGYTEIVPETSPILPISLPFKAENMQSFSQIADTMHYRLNVKLSTSGGVDQALALGNLALEWQVPIQSVAGKRLTLSYRPTNMDDIVGVPCYLVEMRPRLRLKGDVVLESTQDVTMGVENILRIEIVAPDGAAGLMNYQYDYRLSAGDYAAIVPSADSVRDYVLESSERLDVAVQEETEERDRVVGEQLYLAGLLWYYQVDRAARSVAKHYNVNYFRKPSALVCLAHLETALIGGQIAAGIDGVKLILDAANNYFMAIPRTTDLMSRVRFSVATGPDMSSYEHIVLEELFRTEAVSAVKLMQVANALSVPVYEITAENRAEVLANLQLPASDMALIERELNYGQVVCAPRSRLTAGAYTGAGIISIAPEGDDPYIPVRNAYLISGAEKGGELYEPVKEWLSSQGYGGWFSYAENDKAVIQTLITDSDAILLTGKKYYEKLGGKLSEDNNVNYSNYIGGIIFEACTSAWRERFWPFVYVTSVQKTVLLSNVGKASLLIYIDYAGNHTFKPGVERRATWRVISMYGGHYNNALLPQVSGSGAPIFSGYAFEGSADGDFFFTADGIHHDDEITVNLTLNYRSFMCLNENSTTKTKGTFKAVECGLESLKRRNGDTFPVSFGETSGVVAELIDPDVEVEWSWEVEQQYKREDEPPILIDTNEINYEDTSIYELTPRQESGSGWVKVTVKDKHNDECIKEAKIYIGCEPCEEGICRVPGNGFLNINSIEARFSLGKSAQGFSAGDLFLASKQMSPDLATPASLFFSTMAEDTEVVYGDNETLRQIVARQTFLDIVVLDAYGYELRFYDPADRGPKSGGLYQVDAGAEPTVVWRVENPDASPTVYNRLQLTELRGAQQNIHRYSWDNAIDTWSLSKAGGLQVIEKQKEYDALEQNLIITESVSDEQTGLVVSKTRTVLHEFDWGRAMTTQVQDPDRAALTTLIDYYDDPADNATYGKIKSRVHLDGSWVRYFYDAEGRKVREERPLLDAPFSTPSSQTADLQITRYEYSPVDAEDSAMEADRFRPRTITRDTAGLVVEKTYYSYSSDTSTGLRTEIVERCADPSYDYGDFRNLRTLRVYNVSGTDDPGAGKLHRVQYADGRRDTYTYEQGSYNPATKTFTPGGGSYIRESVVHGTVVSPAGIAEKTTQETSVSDDLGNELLRETSVYNGTDYEPVQWTAQEYDGAGRLIKTVDSSGTVTESEWDCCGKTTTSDSRGITTSYDYDDLKRVTEETRLGPLGDITTTYTYDGAGRRTGETVSDGSVSLSSSSRYDLAGRLQTATGQSGLVTAYAYDHGGRITTITRPGGSTEITERYLDGRIKSVSGTGVVARYYEYGVNPDGTRYTTVYTKDPSGPQWEKTTTDYLGRTVKVEKPGAAGSEITRNYYDTNGRLISTSTTGQSDTLYEYDELGNQVRSGLDVDGNNVLELSGSDRISDTETIYTKTAGDWWLETRQQVYAEQGSAVATTTGIRRSRLTGLGTGGLSAESISIDIHGSETVSQVIIDRSTQTETRITDYPDSDIDEVTTHVNGLLMSSKSKTGVETTYFYDGLGRRTGVIDPRTGTTVTAYDVKGRVDYVEDPAGNRTTYTYDPATGLKTAEENADSKYIRYAYNDRAQVEKTWGDALYPVEYEYDAYGRLSRMLTYRGGTGWNGADWPTDPGPGDETRWIYDEATGLLIAKQDAAGKQVTYTYTTGGKLQTRTWARDGGSVVTTYTYDSATGELTDIDYSDTTPDVAFTYDRLGRQQTVTDATGLRTFTYNTNLQLETETMDNATITRSYDGIGRSGGFTLGTDYTVTYGYDTVGRFNNVTWDTNGQTGNVTYGYLANSDLIENVTTDELVTTYSYEPNRNLRTQIKNAYSGTVVSQYDYQYDNLGRRTSVVNPGTAFSQSAFNLYGYNDRSELTGSNRYLGTDVTDTSNPVTSEDRSYLYDNIGNRETATEVLTKQITYDPNPLNQYTSITTDNGTPVVSSLDYDDDGNLLSYEGKSYQWNAENRLIGIKPDTPVDGDKKVEYVYDYMGRRVQKKVSEYSLGAWSLSAQKSFLFDSWNLIKESDGTDTYYVSGLDLSGSLQGAGGIGGILARIDGSEHLYCYDGNGNVGQLLGDNGTIAASYEYDPFGNIVNSGGTLADINPIRFSSKYFDDETGLGYWGYRWYDAGLGRWLSRDPIEEMGGLNLYIFVNNSPTTTVDVKGMISLGQWLYNLIFDKIVGHVKSKVVGHILSNLGSVIPTEENIGPGESDCRKPYIRTLENEITVDKYFQIMQEFIWFGLYKKIEEKPPIQLRNIYYVYSCLCPCFDKRTDTVALGPFGPTKWEKEDVVVDLKYVKFQQYSRFKKIDIEIKSINCVNENKFY